MAARHRTSITLESRRHLYVWETEVAQGYIRYYGVSSNTLPNPTAQGTTTDLRRLLAVAREVAADHHFKLIQFPYNLLEDGARKLHYGDRSCSR